MAVRSPLLTRTARRAAGPPSCRPSLAPLPSLAAVARGGGEPASGWRLRSQHTRAQRRLARWRRSHTLGHQPSFNGRRRRRPRSSGSRGGERWRAGRPLARRGTAAPQVHWAARGAQCPLGQRQHRHDRRGDCGCTCFGPVEPPQPRYSHVAPIIGSRAAAARIAASAAGGARSHPPAATEPSSGGPSFDSWRQRD